MRPPIPWVPMILVTATMTGVILAIAAIIKSPPLPSTATVSEFRFGGCEYLVMKRGGDRGFMHKGNCDNPFHWRDTPAVNLLPEIEIVPPEMEVPATEPIPYRPTI